MRQLPSRGPAVRTVGMRLDNGAAWRVTGLMVRMRARLLHHKVVDHGVIGAHAVGGSHVGIATRTAGTATPEE